MPITARHPRLRSQLRPYYTQLDLQELAGLLAPALQIPLNSLGRVCASTRAEEGEDPTHYDAVWVRDSVWACFGLAAQAHTQEQSKRVLLGLLEYFATPAQRERQERIIARPELAKAADGAMQVLHIRFDGRSESFADVQNGGADQIWNHKQNDAVALTSLAAAEALAIGHLKSEDISPSAWEFLRRLPLYWRALDFSNFADAGAWEEIERVNSSSIALVTRSLELWARRPEFAQDQVFLARLVDAGYDRLAQQLPFESPAHDRTTAFYREADAALLNLIYPAKLDRHTDADRRRVLQQVETLVRERGVIRYVGDSYQCAGFWNAPPAGETDARTDDTSSAHAFAERGRGLTEGTEAEWFFDSWISQAYGILFASSGEKADYLKQVEYFQRALCQITGPGEAGADGRPVPEFALPESYNVLPGEPRRWAPSPITPLNWSKACLILALRQLEASLSLAKRPTAPTYH